MNNSTTDTALYVNLAMTFLNFILGLATHFGWMKFQSSCCKDGSCCELKEEMGTDASHHEDKKPVTDEKKTE